MNIKPCSRICNECAFNGSTKDTLYAEAIDIIMDGRIFPCHMYLKSKTGCEYLGTETLDDIQVCRGYVAFMKKYHKHVARLNPMWVELFDEIDDCELENIISPIDLFENHKGLRERIYLGN